MSRTLAFVTDGAIDLRAFTTFGVNVKPNTQNPIGFFGTGLKYAVAVLCRLGGKVTVVVDGVEHEFYSKAMEFRGKTFDMIRMRRRKGVLAKWSYQALPYTTEFGKTWEPWQVYRELESNTRDENGATILVDEDDSGGMSFLNDEHRGKTLIMVTEPKVIDAHLNRDQIFLPGGLKVREGTDEVQVFNQPSKHLYYRGLRVADLDIPSAFTYNFLGHVDLTEDRTIKFTFMANSMILRHIMKSTDAEYVESVLQLNPEKHYEGRLDFDSTYEMPSATFVGAIGKLRAASVTILPRAMTFYDRYYPKVETDPEVTVTMRRSAWQRVSMVLDCISGNAAMTSILSQELDWEEDDDRFTPFFELRGMVSSKTKERGDDEIPF